MLFVVCAVINEATMNIYVHFFVCVIYVFISLAKNLRVWLLNHKEVYVLC